MLGAAAWACWGVLRAVVATNAELAAITGAPPDTDTHKLSATHTRTHTHRHTHTHTHTHTYTHAHIHTLRGPGGLGVVGARSWLRMRSLSPSQVRRL